MGGWTGVTTHAPPPTLSACTDRQHSCCETLTHPTSGLPLLLAYTPRVGMWYVVGTGSEVLIDTHHVQQTLVFPDSSSCPSVDLDLELSS